MNINVQLADKPADRPAAGVLLTIGLAGIGTIAAVALWLSSLWVAGAVGVAVLMFLLFRFPRLYVYLFFILALVPYSFLTYLDGFRLFGESQLSVNLVGLAWVLNVILFAIYTLWKRENWWQVRFYRPFLVLITISLPSILFTSDWALGLRNWIHLVSPICLSMLLFSTTTDRARALQTIRHIFVIFGAVLIIGFYQLLTGTGSYDVAADTYRLSGIYGQGGEVNYGAILLYLSCLAVPIALQRRSEVNTAATVIASCAVLLLLASQSRMPLLAFLAAAPIMLSKLRVRLKSWFLLFLVLGVAQLSPRVYSRFGGSLLDAPAEFRRKPDIYANIIQRMETWTMLSNQFLDVKTLVIGRGFGFVDNFLLKELDDPMDFYTHAVHNEYLRILLDLGLIGVSLLIGQLVFLYRCGSNLVSTASDVFSRSLGVALCALTVSFAALALTSNMYGVEPHTVIFWVLSALSLACLKWAGRAVPTVGAGAAATLQGG
jgi:hypothetical protein